MRNILIVFILFITNFPTVTQGNSNNNELRVTLQSSVISLDPGGVQDSQSLFVSRQVNCQLVRNQGSTFVLDAAESIKYISPLKIVIKISEKAKFHDNTSVTAEDVLASLNYIKKSRNVFKNLYIWIKKIEIVDDKTILITLEQHIPQFLKVLSSVNFTIFKKSFLEKASKEKALWKVPLGCGGYKVIEFSNEQIKLTPVSKGLPIIFYITKTNQIPVNEVENYDIITLKVIGNSKELDDFDVLDMLDPIQYYVGVNSRSKFWKNKYDRCKFLAGLDTSSLLTSYGQTAIKANHFLPKGTLGYNTTDSFYNQTARLGEKSTNNDSNKKTKSLCLAYLTVSIPENNKNAFFHLFKEHYPNTIKPITDVKKFGEKFVNDNCDLLLFALKSYYLDGYEYLTIFENNDANFSGVYSKNLDTHILKSQLLANAADRAAEYQKIIREIGDLCVIRPILTIPTRRVYVRKKLKAPGIGLISIPQYYLGNISR